MADSALSKIDRAAKCIDELNELFREQRPFTYVLETNTQTRQCATFAKENKAVICDATNIAADAVHNLRTALDHAYWEIVSPFATTPKEERAIQFPFRESAAGLEEAVKNRLAHRVSPAFEQALLDLKPHGDPGGNELLYLIHHLDAIDKHRFPIPTGDYTKVSSDMIRRQVPEFPNITLENCGFGQNRRDIVWRISRIPSNGELGTLLAPSTCIFEKELHIPVEIVFSVRSGSDFRPMIPTLYQMSDVARDTISVIRNA